MPETKVVDDILKAEADADRQRAQHHAEGREVDAARRDRDDGRNPDAEIPHARGQGRARPGIQTRARQDGRFQRPLQESRHQNAQTEEHRDRKDARGCDPGIAYGQPLPETRVDISQRLGARAPDQREERQGSENQQEIDQNRDQCVARRFGRGAQDHGIEVAHNRLQRQEQPDQRETEGGRHHHRLRGVDVADGRERRTDHRQHDEDIGDKRQRPTLEPRNLVIGPFRDIGPQQSGRAPEQVGHQYIDRQQQDTVGCRGHLIEAGDRLRHEGEAYGHAHGHGDPAGGHGRAGLGPQIGEDVVGIVAKKGRPASQSET